MALPDRRRRTRPGRKTDTDLALSNATRYVRLSVGFLNAVGVGVVSIIALIAYIFHQLAELLKGTT